MTEFFIGLCGGIAGGAIVAMFQHPKVKMTASQCGKKLARRRWRK